MTRTRLKLALGFGVGIFLLTACSIYKSMESVATIGMAALGGIVSKYSHDETKRNSKKKV